MFSPEIFTSVFYKRFWPRWTGRQMTGPRVEGALILNKFSFNLESFLCVQVNPWVWTFIYKPLPPVFRGQYGVTLKIPCSWVSQRSWSIRGLGRKWLVSEHGTIGTVGCTSPDWDGACWRYQTTVTTSPPPSDWYRTFQMDPGILKTATLLFLMSIIEVSFSRPQSNTNVSYFQNKSFVYL